MNHARHRQPLLEILCALAILLVLVTASARTVPNAEASARALNLAGPRVVGAGLIARTGAARMIGKAAGLAGAVESGINTANTLVNFQLMGLSRGTGGWITSKYTNQADEELAETLAGVIETVDAIVEDPVGVGMAAATAAKETVVGLLKGDTRAIAETEAAVTEVAIDVVIGGKGAKTVAKTTARAGRRAAAKVGASAAAGASTSGTGGVGSLIEKGLRKLRKSAKPPKSRGSAKSGSGGVPEPITDPNRLLGRARENLLQQVQNRKLRNAIRELYRREARVGDGSSMDAFRFEEATGELLSPRGHGPKLIQRRRQLQKLLREESLSGTDRQIVKEILINIQDALSEGS